MPLLEGDCERKTQASPLQLMQQMLNYLFEQEKNQFQFIAKPRKRAKVAAPQRAEVYQTKAVYVAVHARANRFVNLNGVIYSQALRKVWLLLTDRFSVGSYKSLLACQIEEALAFIDSLTVLDLASV
jgi:hypothetical protein